MARRAISAISLTVLIALSACGDTRTVEEAADRFVMPDAFVLSAPGPDTFNGANLVYRELEFSTLVTQRQACTLATDALVLWYGTEADPTTEWSDERYVCEITMPAAHGVDRATARVTRFMDDNGYITDLDLPETVDNVLVQFSIDK